METFHLLVKTKYILEQIHYEYCALFVALFLALRACIFRWTFCCIFLESFLCTQIKLELFSPEIVSALENKELLSHLRVCRKNTTIAQTGGGITTDGPLYTGKTHCQKSIRIRSFSGPNVGKYGPEKL